MRFKEKQAFTLVELIVVITILAILGTIAFISLQGYSKDARNSTRISDTASMNKVLELYQLKKGKYPLPDSGQNVSYNSDLLRTQGFFGETVLKELGNMISEIPVDPLYKGNYIYSLSYNQKEFEILTPYEGDDLVNNLLLQEVRADNGFIPKLSGNYNGVFVKSSNYIVPTPSIINALISDSTTGLNLVNLDSQVVTGGKNIPMLGNEVIGSGTLSGLTLTGVLLNGDLENYKENIMDAIEEAYIGSSITDLQKIDYALNGNRDNVFDYIVLGKSTSNSTSVASCDENSKPDDSGNMIFVEGMPSTPNQAYEKNADSCGFSCKPGYSGENCGTYTRFVFDSGTDNNVVIDNNSGLFRQSDGNQANRNWDSATSYCNQLNLGGYTGEWRLPYYFEMVYLKDASNSQYINTDFFTIDRDDGYWLLADTSETKAKAITFTSYGYSSTSADKTSSSKSLRCVRNDDTIRTCNEATRPEDNGYIIYSDGGATSNNQPYQQDVSDCGYSCKDGYTGADCSTYTRFQFVNGTNDSVVRDNTKNLYRESDGTKPKIDWFSATSYCDSLNSSGFGGYTSGWRLPTKVEFPYIRSGTASIYYTEYFSFFNECYWTSDEVDTEVICLSLSKYGRSTTGKDKLETARIRCIRDDI